MIFIQRMGEGAQLKCFGLKGPFIRFLKISPFRSYQMHHIFQRICKLHKRSHAIIILIMIMIMMNDYLRLEKTYVRN